MMLAARVKREQNLCMRGCGGPAGFFSAVSHVIHTQGKTRLLSNSLRSIPVESVHFVPHNRNNATLILLTEISDKGQYGDLYEEKLVWRPNHLLVILPVLPHWLCTNIARKEVVYSSIM